jgi:transposase InsO family protein
MFLAEDGIEHQLLAVYESQQNGQAEWINRTLQEKAESMRPDAGLSKRFWQFSLDCA